MQKHSFCTPSTSHPQIRYNQKKNLLTCRLEKFEKESKVSEHEHLVVQLRKRRDELSETVADDQNRQLHKLSKENHRLSEEFDQLAALNTQMQNSLLESIRNMQRINTCDKSCVAFDLCKKRILIVGRVYVLPVWKRFTAS